MPDVTSMVYNDIDDDAARLFSRTSATRAECDSFALETFGGPVYPVAVQGATSYTVVAGQAGDKIVQFREKDALLDMQILELAKRIHGGVVVCASMLGWIGDNAGPQLAVYAMDKIPGDNYVLARSTLAEDRLLHLETIRGLAGFFAQAWREPIPSDQVDVDAMIAEILSSLENLGSSGILTPSLQTLLAKVINHIPTLFSKEFRLALTHSDLNELNILVDSTIGRITGVIDWTNAGTQPFGFALYVLDDFIGYMGPNGRVYYDNSELLRDEFWAAFAANAGKLSETDLERIRIARMAGYFLRYGIAHNSKQKGVAGIESLSVRHRVCYLEAGLEG
ncbi:hypothetical protein PgNI_05385 [Pyricularia grisea]|uniref:Aminoglycoside phosphotransferase domain-containing protein n=1 Tax=Pyricularia grisea TaxID=148305 RepID=A0A6P8B4K2_PYRGI|nr:hypothetical protein PgNI_05385 [Pyricularia grisea]TLD10180.1 hypothetical protein PgNI_05385 [Pyricularia grisea]